MHAGLRATLARARDISAAFAAWDDFDHAGAARVLLDTYVAVAAEPLRDHVSALRLLAGAASAKRTGLQLWDLCLNAHRRRRLARLSGLAGNCLHPNAARQPATGWPAQRVSPVAGYLSVG